MLRLLFVLLAIRSCSSLDYSFPKCCDSESVLEEQDSSYSCAEDVDKRTQILTNRTNFVGSLEAGLCIDVEKTVSLFHSNGSDLIKVRDLEVDFYPKCCPLNFFYNSTTHGCVKSQSQQTFFSESFVKVGLPHCKIIVDVPVNTFSGLEVSNGSLHVNVNQRNSVYAEGLYCADIDQNNATVVRICHNNYDVCDRIRCIRKCCSDGQSFVNGSQCRNTFVHGLDFSSFARNMDNINDPFAVIHDGYTPPLYPISPQRFNFHLDSKGMFTMVEVDSSLGKINVTRRYNFDEQVYCAEHAIKKATRTNSHMFFRGFPLQKEWKFIYTAVAMAISCIFLTITILYYCISDEKKTLFGKTLISYCFTSLICFLLLSYMGLNTRRPAKGARICVVVAFFIFYLTLSMFAWMNVMCIDIYCTFGSSKSFSSRQFKSKELKRFLLYCLHGWGTPLVLTALPLIFFHIEGLPFWIKLIVKEEKCFMHRGDGNYGLFLFSSVPVAIMQFSNLILFIKTALYCWKVKKEINKMNDTHAMKGEKKQKFIKFRDRFGLLLKLFLIMGTSFLFEVVSTFYDFKKNDTTAVIELIWDTFNSLQGVFIFAIFILKKRILKKFEKKVGLAKLRKISLVSSSMTQTTSLPTISNK